MKRFTNFLISTSSFIDFLICRSADLGKQFTSSNHLPASGFWLLFLAFISFSSCQTKDTSKEKINNYESLIQDFKSPPIIYSTAPLWVWNDEITHEKIDFQLAEYKKVGIHQAFIHPRPGLIFEYLNDSWFELAKYTVEKGKELDMNIWIYDENSYPSGFAGGHVPASFPPDKDPVAGLQLQKISELDDADLEKYIIIIKRDGDSFKDITDNSGNYLDQRGEYYAFSKWYYPKQGWLGGFTYVDLLDSGITEKFIELTMDGYKKYIGEDFGGRVPGVFTDEPNIGASGRNVIRFTPALFDRFEKEYGYKLSDKLPFLYEEIGDWKNVRHDYYKLLLTLFIERWSKPFYDYAEANNLNWTGHYWEHGWPNPYHGGDNMAMYAWHQWPGIDMLFNDEEGRPDQFGNIRSAKELSSVVNQLNKERALSETYGGSGWELSFWDMKRQGDWEYVLGVNFMNQHLTHMTLKGARKRDYPQSMSYHTPWWDHYKYLNDYYTRMSYALSQGQQVNKILIIEPTSTAWMYHSPGGSQIEKMTEIKNSFHEMLNMMEKYQVEYDLGCEDIIKDHGRVDGKYFVIGERSYELVVIPPNFESFEKSTFGLINQYLNKGGKVLSFAGIPRYLEGEESPNMIQSIESAGNKWINEENLTTSIINEHFLSNGFQAIDPDNWQGRVFHMRRQFGDGQLMFWTNYDKTANAQIRFKTKGAFVVDMNAFTGELTGLPAVEDKGMVQVDLGLPPAGSALLYISDKKLDLPIGGIMKLNQPVAIQASETMVNRLEPNTLTLDYCDLHLNNKTFNDIYFYVAADSIYKFYLKEPYGAANYNPWSHAVQYKTNILDMNDFDQESGFKVVYPFYIEKGSIPTSLKAVIERTHLYSIQVNGSPVEPLNGEWWLDKDFGVVDIAGNLKTGRNELSITAKPMDIQAEVEPVYLVGDFNVKNADKGWVITSSKEMDLGSWKNQDMPFYSHEVVYARKFTNESANADYKVSLGDWNGTVAEIKVNGQSAGILVSQPWEMEISDLVAEGENTVEVVVTGSLKNQMGPHHNNPRRGFVTPWSFFAAPDHQPPATEYDLIDYGLYEEFEILQY
ncbi:glycosyl hydrolase [Bacteroidota bacterium]